MQPLSPFASHLTATTRRATVMPPAAVPDESPARRVTLGRVVGASVVLAAGALSLAGCSSGPPPDIGMVVTHTPVNSQQSTATVKAVVTNIGPPIAHPLFLVTDNHSGYRYSYDEVIPADKITSNECQPDRGILYQKIDNNTVGVEGCADQLATNQTRTYAFSFPARANANYYDVQMVNAGRNARTLSRSVDASLQPVVPQTR